MYVDDTDLCAFKNGFMGTLEVINKHLRLLNTWHEALRVTGGDLQLKNVTRRYKTTVGK